jgi:uncharacterized protein (DUF302 family)
MRHLFLISILLFAAQACAETPAAPSPARIFSAEKNFEDAKADLLLAIEGRGLVVSYTSHAQEMLDRTAEAVGVKERIYDKAEIILFCKTDLSHALVASNPHNIVLCPYAIAVYVLINEPGKVYMSFREPYAGDEVVKPITDLLTEIIEEAIG